ncbi:MAG: hypothetical protein ACFNME_09595 [Actinomyces dentalis]
MGTLHTWMRSPASGQYSGLLHNQFSWAPTMSMKASSPEASKRMNKADGAILPVTTAHSGGPYSTGL